MKGIWGPESSFPPKYPSARVLVQHGLRMVTSGIEKSCGCGVEFVIEDIPRATAAVRRKDARDV